MKGEVNTRFEGLNKKMEELRGLYGKAEQLMLELEQHGYDVVASANARGKLEGVLAYKQHVEHRFETIVQKVQAVAEV
jgi:hypothetical protein